ncbi:hypothetical protein LTS01_026190, partial [Friedmanniomyces endolithicus]
MNGVVPPLLRNPRAQLLLPAVQDQRADTADHQPDHQDAADGEGDEERAAEVRDGGVVAEAD